MKHLILFSSLLLMMLGGIPKASAQDLNYYDASFTLESADLKEALHTRIEDHQEYEYGTVKDILRQSDRSVQSEDSIRLLYTGRVIHRFDFASDPTDASFFNSWNREHVWPKSLGNFGPDGAYGEKGANTDAHSLRPVDMTVNSARSNKNFGEGGSDVYDDGEDTGCKSTATTWEPRDAVKGDVARMAFYMAVRYEGGQSSAGDNEPNLELIAGASTSPNPELGDLATLLDWHRQDPVDASELFRNDVVENWQGNRNPFIDHPEFAERIFGQDTAQSMYFTNLSKSPVQPGGMEDVTVSVEAVGASSTPVLYYGNSWQEVLDSSFSITMTATSGNNYTATIPGQDFGAPVRFRIVHEASDTSHISHGYKTAPEPFEGVITSIVDIQGPGEYSPYAYEIVDANGVQEFPAMDSVRNIKGVVTGVFGNSFFIQESNELRSGIYVYQSSVFPEIGDSAIVIGKIKEYYNLTEMTDIEDVLILSSNNPLPVFQEVSTGDIATNAPQAEDYESLLVKVFNAENTGVPTPAFGMFLVNDGSGECLVWNSPLFSYEPTEGVSYNISGPLYFNFDNFKIALRSIDDVEAGTDFNAARITEATIPAQNFLYLTFSENVTQPTVENIANYSFSGDIAISNAEQGFIENQVILTLSGLPTGLHTVVVNGVEDFAGNITVDTAEFTSAFSNVSLEEWMEEAQMDIAILGETLHIESETQWKSLAIIDQVGREVATIREGSQWSTRLEDGVYLLRVETESGDVVLRIKM